MNVCVLAFVMWFSVALWFGHEVGSMVLSRDRITSDVFVPVPARPCWIQLRQIENMTDVHFGIHADFTFLKSSLSSCLIVPNNST